MILYGGQQTPEDKLLLSRAYDAIELSQRRGTPRFLGFLNEHEAQMLRANISQRTDISFFGGYSGAQRVMLGAGAEEDDFPITALEFSYRPEFSLTHRDFLGALMALGVRRETVGDILAGSGRAVVFFSDDIVPYVFSNVEKIGRVGVKISYADAADLPQTDEGKESVYSVSSLRLDAFVAAVCNLSREKASRLIRSELVTVDHIINTGAAFTLSEGAAVAVRKYGKYILTSVLGTSRKGKLRISVRHFG